MINVKKYAAEAVKYREELCVLLRTLNPRDIEQGLLVLKDSLLSKDFKSAILSKTRGLIDDYNLEFKEGSIYLKASVNARQLGPLDVSYQISIQELRFDDTGHKLYATFKETADSRGNMAQKLALKAALMNGPLLKTASRFSNAPWAHVDGNHVLLDFDRLDFAKGLPSSLCLGYVSAKDSKLTLSFNV